MMVDFNEDHGDNIPEDISTAELETLFLSWRDYLNPEESSVARLSAATEIGKTQPKTSTIL